MEEQETITYMEFRAWMVGLIRGKGGALPDMDDWVKIKEMMDKVVPEKETVTIPIPRDTAPYQPHPDLVPPMVNPWERPYPWCSEPYIGDVPPYDPVWCGGYWPATSIDSSTKQTTTPTCTQFASVSDIFNDWKEDGSKKEIS